MWPRIGVKRRATCCDGSSRVSHESVGRALKHLAPLLATPLLILLLLQCAPIPSIYCDLQGQLTETTSTTTIPTTTTAAAVTTTTIKISEMTTTNMTQIARLTNEANNEAEKQINTSTFSTNNGEIRTNSPQTTTISNAILPIELQTTTSSTTTASSSSRLGLNDNNVGHFALISEQESVSPASDQSSESSSVPTLVVATNPPSQSQPQSSPHRQGRSSQSSLHLAATYSAPQTSRLSAYSPATMLAQGSRIGNNNNNDADYENHAHNQHFPHTTVAPKPVTDPIIVCYLGSWSVYRPGVSKFTPENINPFLCTHVIYAFAGLSSKLELKPFDSYNDITQGGYRKFTSLKEHNKQLKTLIAVGGWNEGSSR